MAATVVHRGDVVVCQVAKTVDIRRVYEAIELACMHSSDIINCTYRFDFTVLD